MESNSTQKPQDRVKQLKRRLKILLLFAIGLLIYRIVEQKVPLKIQSLARNQLQIHQAEIIKTYDLPLREISSASMSSKDGVITVLGDQDSKMVQVEFDQFAEISSLRSMDIASLIPGAEESRQTQDINQDQHPSDSDFEGLTQDDQGRFFVLQEGTARIFVFDSNFTNLVGNLMLDYPRTLKEVPNDLFEGLILLGNGHILVTKEKNPAVIMEFGPDQDQALGYRPLTLPPVPQAFSFADTGAALKLLGQWSLAEPTEKGLIPAYQDCDLSDLTLTREGYLALLSDQCQAIFLVPQLDPNQNLAGVAHELSLPSKIKNPEALIDRGAGEFFIGRDRKEQKNNFYLVKVSGEFPLPLGAVKAPLK